MVFQFLCLLSCLPLGRVSSLLCPLQRLQRFLTGGKKKILVISNVSADPSEEFYLGSIINFIAIYDH